MVIKDLELIHFRNFSRTQFKFHPKINFFVGRNGIGKTNLIEAIYLITHLKSFRTNNNRNLIENLNFDYAHIHSNITIAPTDHSIKLSIRKDGKSVYLDEKPLKYTSDFLSNIYSMIIATDLIIDYKSNLKSKRKLFDRFCLRAFSSYAELLKEHRKIINNKNVLTRSGKKELFPIWNDLLVQNSNKIYQVRKKVIDQINETLAENYFFLTEKEEVLNIYYKSDLKHEKLRNEEIIELLNGKIDQEIKIGYSYYGPQKDVFWFELDGKNEKLGFSQGEFKSSFLSLQLSLNQILTKEKEDIPIFLLDDIFSELDEITCGKIFSEFQKRENQLFLSTSIDRNIDSYDCSKFNL